MSHSIKLVLKLALVLWGLAATAAPVKVVGITEPFQDVILSAPVPGIVTVQSVKEGDYVKTNAVIVELDKMIEELEVVRRQLIVNVKSNDLESTKRLFKSTKGVSKEELEKKETEFKMAVVDLETAAEQLRRRVVTSPLSGTITELFLDVGEASQAFAPLVRVVDTHRCIFVADVEPSVGPRLALGQTVPLDVLIGDRSVKVSAKIIFLAPVVDAASGLLKVKAVFQNPEGKIRPGVAGSILLE